MDERTGVVTFKGGPLTLLGSTPEEGQAAPAFTVRTGLGPDSEYTPDTDGGTVRILNVVPSLDTPVCSIQTKRMNEEAGSLPGVKVVTVSADLPPAQARWCGAEGVENVTCASDYFDGSFARGFGLRIKELGVLTRAVFVLDADGTVRYSQIVPEITQEPDYEPVLSAARELAG
ncbi:MAG: thiol peroxidase [Planctomycetota bacterium]|jgi:thiol peroxidase